MTTTRSPAEDRLLDAALEQMFGRAAPAVRTERARPRWLAAAVLLLGVGVVVASLRWRASPSPDTAVPVQEPEPRPLPREVTVQNVAELRAQPDAVENLEASLGGPADLPELARLTKLRRLNLLAIPTDRTAPAAGSFLAARGKADLLEPLAELQSMEELGLPFEAPLLAEQLAPLRRLPSLRRLEFFGATGDAALGAALAALPKLRELRVRSTVVGPELFAALEPLHLRSLELAACQGLDDAAFAVLARLATLHRLEITFQTSEASGMRTLDRAAFAAFAALPMLRELLLDESAFDDRWLSQLPAGLELLDLGDRPMGSLAAEQLRRLGNLRDLTFGCGLEASVAAELLGSLRLRRLYYRGREVTPELLGAIAAQPDLEELRIRIRSDAIDLAPLARAPRLSMILVQAWMSGRFGAIREGPGLEQLRALRACRHLRRVVTSNCEFVAGDVRELFDKGVEVECIEYR